MTHAFNIWDYGWFLIAAAAAVAVYFLVIKPRLAATVRLLGKDALVADAEGWLAWVKAKLMGVKTLFLALLAGVPQAVQLIDTDTLYDLQQMPWGEILDPKIANWFSLGCAILIPVTHMFGMKHAAETEPQGDE